MAELAYATREALDSRIEGVKNSIAFEKEVTDIRFQSMERLLDERLGKMEAVMEKNLAKHDAIAARLEGKIEALGAEVHTLQNKFVWNIAWVGIAMTVILAAAQRLWK